MHHAVCIQYFGLEIIVPKIHNMSQINCDIFFICNFKDPLSTIISTGRCIEDFTRIIKS